MESGTCIEIYIIFCMYVFVVTRKILQELAYITAWILLYVIATILSFVEFGISSVYADHN